MGTPETEGGSSVELRTIRVFLVLAEELHFTRTAERLLVTQSRVSQVVRELERLVGGELFTRSSRRVTLTELGQSLRDDLAPACAGIDDAISAARSRSGTVTRELRIGAYHAVSYGAFFFDAAHDFESAHPEVQIVSVELGIQRNPLDALRSGEVDALATRLPVSDLDLVVGARLSREKRVLLVARDHPLATRSEVSWEDVGDYVVNDSRHLPRETMTHFAPPRTPSGRLIRRCGLDTFVGLLAGLSAGRIVHPTVPSLAATITHLPITAVPITDLPPSETALVWRADRSDRPLLRAFADHIEQWTNAHNVPSDDAVAPVADRINGH